MSNFYCCNHAPVHCAVVIEVLVMYSKKGLIREDVCCHDALSG